MNSNQKRKPGKHRKGGGSGKKETPTLSMIRVRNSSQTSRGATTGSGGASGAKAVKAVAVAAKR